MRRRAMLAALAAAAAVRRRPARAQGGMPMAQRAAVVIGVDRAGDLPRLAAAAAAAGRVADWLEAEGFAVQRFLDSAGPVRVAAIYDAIEALVERGTLEQLVVYFGGHGFLNNYAEHWLLSNAPDNPNEAVSLVETVELARLSGIPSVVLLSDACRSRADTLRAERVRGSLIFPNNGAAGAVDPEVDRFLAAAPGDPALELPVGQTASSYEAVFTASFLSAFERTDPALVREVGGLPVVPNRLLKESRYLERETARRVAARSLRLHQQPKAIVESGPEVFIGRAHPPPPPTGPIAPVSPAPLPPTVADVAARELTLAGARLPPLKAPLDPALVPPRAEDVDRLAEDTGFLASQAQIRSASAAAAASFEAGSGIALFGARVDRVAAGPGIIANLLTAGGDGRPAIVRLTAKGRRAASLLLGFAGGGGTVVAALDDYVGAVVVEAGRVVSVSYVPARGSSRWRGDRQVTERLERLRAAVATAARFGVFRIEGEREERRLRAAWFLKSIILGKYIDPALGLYAAYAFVEAGLPEEVGSVADVMRGDLGVDLFDVAMLAGRLAGPPPADPRQTVPFCPMLAQGWGLLRVRGVALPELVAEAGYRLRPALWTSFEEAVLRPLAEALASGRLL